MGAANLAQGKNTRFGQQKWCLQKLVRIANSPSCQMNTFILVICLWVAIDPRMI
jgi:hypothetical protein